MLSHIVAIKNYTLRYMSHIKLMIIKEIEL